MTHLKRILAALLSLAMLNAALAGCASEPASDDNNAAADTTAADTAVSGDDTSEAAETTTSKPKADVPESDFEGYNFRFLIENENLDTNVYRNVVVEAENGDVLNDAIFERNAAIEEDFGVVLSQIPADVPSTDAQKMILAGDDGFDAIANYQSDMYKIATNGSLVSFYDIPYIDLDGAWWDQSMKEQMTIAGNLFYHTGEILLYDDVLTTCAIFNKAMWEDRKLDNPYDMVKDGTWTIDKITEISHGVNTDLNGDGAMNDKDLWGFVGELAAGINFFHGAGEQTVTNNGDSLEITYGGERAVSVVEKILALLSSDDVLIPDTAITNNDRWKITSAMFQQDQILIRTTTFQPVPRDLRKMETDFGVLPIPKFDEAQEKYYSTMNSTFGVVAVPVTSTDLDRAGIILEAMAVESISTVSPAFYEVSLQGKVFRDDDSQEMLDIIFANKVYDIGLLFNVGTFSDIMRNQIKAGTNTFVSTLEGKTEAAQLEIEKLVEAFGG